ncbi:hypothetical protein EAH_00039620 [Eimeria acervulina]|uniref:Uncharacterized protein n=1 Tax=Eimeria acervulina TaxID=5801 RepID=U6GW91_EIMAC|nr:hypothetical protein EAH_00039620 [Eimeria acervulina]CDI83503.1 hypothetical protein EAH_00039620 [Eimeria acervulina]
MLARQEPRMIKIYYDRPSGGDATGGFGKYCNGANGVPYPHAIQPEMLLPRKQHAKQACLYQQRGPLQRKFTDCPTPAMPHQHGNVGHPKQKIRVWVDAMLFSAERL